MEAKHLGSWVQFKKGETRKYVLPFLWVEWWLERLVYRLKHSAVVELVKIMGGLTIIVTIGTYIYEGPKRERDRVLAQEATRKSHIYQAWQIINAAAGKGGGGGVYQAMLDLRAKNESLEGINLKNAQLEEKDFSEWKLEWAKLMEANLSRANFSDANLYGADLSDANLWGANLSRVILRGAVFNRAILTEADLRGADIWGANFSEANLDGADLSSTKLTWTLLRGADIRGAIGLSCWRLREAKEWETSYRDEELACGEPIPQ